MITVTATIRETPPDHRGGHDLARDEITVEADDYDQALEQIKPAIPQGWQVIAVLVDR